MAISRYIATFMVAILTATSTVSAQEVKLASGETFKLAPGVKTSSYKAGDKVSVRFTEKNGAKTADQIMAARN